GRQPDGWEPRRAAGVSPTGGNPGEPRASARRVGTACGPAILGPTPPGSPNYPGADAARLALVYYFHGSLLVAHFHDVRLLASW
ncbi:MAG TPA: hypothetical protein PLF81_03535, partial [Candidatus Anammoximicrobium sp.]|nr:hypothetical protein [Candidatus Anammoximicrobium sp.]